MEFVVSDLREKLDHSELSLSLPLGAEWLFSLYLRGSKGDLGLILRVI